MTATVSRRSRLRPAPPAVTRICLRCRKPFTSTGYRRCEKCHHAELQYGALAEHVRRAPSLEVPE